MYLFSDVLELFPLTVQSSDMVILLITDYRILPANVDTFWLQTLRSLIMSADGLANSLLR